MNNKNILIVILTIVTGIFALLYFSQDREEFRLQQLDFNDQFKEDVQKFDKQFNSFFGNQETSHHNSTNSTEQAIAQKRVQKNEFKDFEQEFKDFDKSFKDFDKEFENF